ncbi:aminotransferase class-III [Pseudomonas sp. CF161]|nr:aminotransferase class-III [Pseudomonas sp. CF161]
MLLSTVKALEEKVSQLGADTVAAFICEPIQGSGGVIVPPKGFLKAMREACDRLGILLIVDEVITGFGRTGPLFACETDNVSPDMLTVAKGLTSGYAPMGATFIAEHIYSVLAEAGRDGTALGHGQTYAGHPVSAAIANATLDLYEGGLLQNGVSVGAYFQQRLKELESIECVGEVRGRGLLAAVELVVDKRTKAKPAANLKLGQQVLKHAFEEGLVFRAFADDILGFAPSLNYTAADIDKLMEILKHSINKTIASSL